MDPLAQLRDIQLGESVSWWPLAYGWWLAGLFAVGVIALAVWLLVRQRRAYAAKRQALAELASLDIEHNQALAHMNSLIKRICMHYFPSSQVASMHGETWIDFLRSKLDEKSAPKLMAQLESWQRELYQQQQNAQRPEIRQALTEWINSAITRSVAMKTLQEGGNV